MQLTGPGPESEAIKSCGLERPEEESVNPLSAAARITAFNERWNPVT
jgi:hypothetical protein